MILTLAASFAMYIALMHFALHLSTRLIILVMLPTGVGTGVAASIGYSRWLSQYRAGSPRVAEKPRSNTRPFRISVQLLSLAAAACCAGALLWAGHRIEAALFDLLSAALAAWIIVTLPRKRS